MRHSPVAALAATLLLSGAMSAEGQRLEIALPLDLAPPGARSAGMGRAFVGLADDATAAAANPAGLVNLLRPEISYHFRIDEVDAVKRDFNGQGLLTSTASNIVPAYFSLVMPVAGGRVAWSAYYQQTVRGTFSFRENFATGAGNSYVYGSQDDSSLTIGQVGGSVAFSAAGGLLAAGASVARSYASLDSRSRSFTLVENALGRSQSVFDDRVDDVEQAWTYNIGLRTQPTNHIAVGAVYRSGASFELDLLEEWVSSANSGDRQSYTLHGPSRFGVPIEVPPSYGVGVSIKPGDGRATINIDAMRFRYSKLVPGFGRFGEEPGISDGTEIHVGAEYAFTLPRQWLLSIRGGGYSDPGHHPDEGLRPAANASTTIDTGTVHAATGFGLVMNQSIQIDAAYVHSADKREFLLSTVVRF